MSLLGISRLHLLTAFVTLLAFGGDIIADSIVDALGEHCTAQTCPSNSDYEKTPCSHCSCAVHNGNVIASTATVNVSGAFTASFFCLITEPPSPVGLPAAIDHPPQLV